MMSSLPCASPVSTSSYVVITVTNTLVPSVNISAGSNSICQGMPVTFTAVPANGGASPSFAWQVNGSPVAGANSSIFTSSTLANGDQVEVIMSSSLGCVVPATAVSNRVNMLVTPVFSPSISITANPSPVCPSVATTFTANVTNGGSSYSVRWFRNNSAVANGTSSIIFSDLKPSDNIHAEVTSNDMCANPRQAVSNQLSVVLDDSGCPKDIHVPTGFTPNNDGRNDILRPLIKGHVTSYSFTIYNRWGEKVFETSDPGKGWDGKFRGLLLDTQVFVWYCTYQFPNREKQMVKGTVTLIR
jgi:gliding motility-associated-like protein